MHNNYLKLISTVGLSVFINELEKYAKVKVWFGKRGDGAWECWLASANTGGQIKKLGTKSVTQEWMSESSDDDIEFAREALALFSIEFEINKQEQTKWN